MEYKVENYFSTTKYACCSYLVRIGLILFEKKTNNRFNCEDFTLIKYIIVIMLSVLGMIMCICTIMHLLLSQGIRCLT